MPESPNDLVKVFSNAGVDVQSVGVEQVEEVEKLLGLARSDPIEAVARVLKARQELCFVEETIHGGLRVAATLEHLQGDGATQLLLLGGVDDAAPAQADHLDDPEAPEPPQVMEDTGYAASTMATDGERVFAMFATGDVLAYDLDGEFLWFRGLGPLENAYGHAASLAVHNETVIVQIDQGHDPKAGVSALVGLDATTGEIAWRTPRPVPNSWSSPVVIQVGDQYQILTTADPWVIAYDADEGKELWRTECLMGDVGPSVAYANGIVYAANDMSDLTAIRASAADGFEIGDIVWTGDEGLPDTSSPATNGELVFIVSSYGTVTCYDAASGAKVWDQDLEATFQSSPVIAGPNVYLADADGVTHIFEAAREYKAVGSGNIAEMITATPAFIGGRIYLRGETHLYGIGTDETEE